MNSEKDVLDGQHAIEMLKKHLGSLKHTPTILVVEDNTSDYELLMGALKGYRVNIQQCATGKDALYMLASTRVDLVLLDLKLPDIGGLDVLRAVRTVPQFIVLSGSEDPAERKEALRMGALDVWSKPVTSEQLAVVFERVI